MKKFKIPVSWEVSGIIIIEANSLDEALEIFDKTNDHIPLPHDNEYIDGSFQREDEETCSLNNNKKRDFWVFDKENNRIITEDDSINVLYADDLTCPDHVLEEIVRLHNSDKNAQNTLGHGSLIDDYLLNEPNCSQEDREEIVETLYKYYES